MKDQVIGSIVTHCPNCEVRLQMLQTLALLLLQRFGWKLKARLPAERKFVLVGTPHTSNWDFPVSLLAMRALGLRFRWVAKHTVFRGPAGPIMRSLGGIAVDRQGPGGFVEQAAAMFEGSDDLVLAIAPEGTRSHRSYWKTGFHVIAMKANVPIALGYLDYGTKELGIGLSFYPTADIERDFERIRAFYAGKTGKYPDQQTEPRLLIHR